MKTKHFSRHRRHRLETQGLTGFTDQQLYDYQFGFRFAYATCTLLVLIGIILKNLPLLITMMVIAFFGTLLPRHPLDYLYNHLVRHLIGKKEIPVRAAQAKFACAIATIWLGVTIYLFYVGLDFWAYVMGGILVLIASLVSILDFCIPSIIYKYLFRKP
ncbi:MAG: DUF4395 family protein [Candidatus Peregrinibacteria bacterium]|nr:DUF4395 family protein [Candidatus Peregrinibacteria bacterium]